MNTVVKVSNLVKRYQDLVAVDHLNLEIKEGEILGLLGPNGSGKTTTLNCLMALLSYDKGEIEIFGKPMTPESYRSKRDIGIVLQNVAVFNSLTVYQNIDFFCGLYIKDNQKRKKYVKEALEFTELKDFSKFYPKKLSGGLVRRLNIACGIAHKPKLIILDEPTVAVDPQSRNKILEGITQLNRDGATIIYTSHYMEEIEQICSRIVIMDKGKSIASGTTDELKLMLKNNEKISIEIRELSNKVLAGIRQINHIYETSYQNGMLTVKCNGGKHNLIHVMTYLQEHNVSFGRANSELPTLNDVFLEITGKELRDDA